DHLEQPASLGLAERYVLAAKRERGAVDGGERRAQLVRHGRDEVRLESLDGPLGGEVTEREDRSVLETHGGDRQPELAAVDLDWLRLRAQRAGLREVSDLRPGREDVVGAATERLGGRESGHVLDRRIPETDDPVPFDEYDTVGDMLDYEGGSRAFLCLAIEARVVDRDGCASRQVHGEVEIVLVVEPSRICRDEHERAEGSTGGGERYDHRRLHPELVQDPVVLGVLRRRDEELVRVRPVERGL